MPGSVTNYSKIIDPGVATDRRNKIVSAFQSPKFNRIVNRIAHDEEPTEAEVSDALDHLKVCRKDVDKEIELFKSNYRHRLLDRAISPRPTLEILPLEDFLPDLELKIAGAAAASRNGAGVTWGAEAITQLSGYAVALVKFDTLAPIAMPGQYLLLDPTGSPPASSDLVVVECENRQRFARRIWIDKTGAQIQLEAANITRPYPPLTLTPGLSFLRRVTGVLFHGPNVTAGKLGEEWVAPSGVTSGLFADVIGIRVEGTCLEPIARDGQIVLVKHSMDISSVRKAALMCVDSAEIGAVIKRCYPGNDEWILTPVNPIDLEDPIRIPVAEILHVLSHRRGPL